MMVEAHQAMHQVMHMEHLEVVEHLKQVKLEAKVEVLMEGMELPLLGYQQEKVQQVQTVVQDTLAVAAVVVPSLIMVLAAVVVLVVEMVVKVQDTLLDLELLTPDLAVEETLKTKQQEMADQVFLLP